ncbi:MAG: HEAT repeat domain-containing protein [Deltaproteobacteria bacterium]|nr:HEAT repeat domain-containing protein [Deltaproteobacteria bacterium]
MRRALSIACVLALAVTARSETIHLTPPIIHALTPIDTLPNPDHLDLVFNNQTLENLRALALSRDGTVDLGIQLRAIRMLASYCPSASPCGTGTPTHDALEQLLVDYEAVENDGIEGTPTPHDVLRLRAAIETLGVVGRSAGVAEDVNRLLPFLVHPSRDIRATTARALGYLCNTQAIVPLRIRLQNEASAQVRLAISAALRDLGTGQCPT